jgi:hypothetical protein
MVPVGEIDMTLRSGEAALQLLQIVNTGETAVFVASTAVACPRWSKLTVTG